MSEENLPDPTDAKSSAEVNADWAAIGAFLAGEPDAGQVASVEAWLATHRADARLVALVADRAERLRQQADIPVDTEVALRAVRARIAADPSARPDLRVQSGGFPRRMQEPRALAARPKRWALGVALAAGVAAVVAVSQLWGRGEGTPREYRTAVGQRDSVRLPDGSLVVLAPASRLTLTSSFGRPARDVELEGAAYFEVVHNATQPFTVRAGGADVRDLGTAFSVKTGREGSVSVVVTQGVVSVERAAAGADSVAPVELQAGDRVVLSGGRVAVARGVVTAEDVAWTRGRLTYRDTPMREVQVDLQRWYGVDLQITDSTLANRTLTATFQGDSAAQVVRLIALALGAEAIRRGDAVLLQPLSAPPPAQR